MERLALEHGLGWRIHIEGSGTSAGLAQLSAAPKVTGGSQALEADGFIEHAPWMALSE